ncbi:MAG: TetR/AcrR family transcriptional regulator [Actinobacteria bacterium ATB1]|nr:TetR/AcrR family transcriptional regulator [Actinobacteria bacterium ATB1]
MSSHREASAGRDRKTAKSEVRERIPLHVTAVVDAAEEIVDADGLDALSMTELAARLGVRVPSLYKHVDGIEDVRRRLGLLGVADLAEACRSAVLARSGPDALHALASAFRGYVRVHPGRYAAQVRLALRDDSDYWREANRAIEAVSAVFRSYGLEGDAVRRGVVAFWAAVHGFVQLESVGAMAGYVDVDVTFDGLVAAFSRSLEDSVWCDVATALRGTGKSRNAKTQRTTGTETETKRKARERS